MTINTMTTLHDHDQGQASNGIIISDMKQRCAQAQSTFPMLSRREKQRVLLGPSTPMSHPMDLSRMRKQEIINEFRKLEIVKCLLEDWIENGGGVPFRNRVPSVHAHRVSEGDQELRLL